jgi:hypothetical protein
MRVFEVFLRSGTKVEIVAEVLQEAQGEDSKVYFYRDKGLKQITAYFHREEVAGIIFGPENASAASPRFR